MWKITVTYDDNSKVTLTGKQNKLSLELAKHYRMLYGRSGNALFQQYPKNKNNPILLDDYIKNLEG